MIQLAPEKHQSQKCCSLWTALERQKRKVNSGQLCWHVKCPGEDTNSSSTPGKRHSQIIGFYASSSCIFHQWMVSCFWI